MRRLLLRKLLLAVLVSLLFAWPVSMQSQSADDASQANARQARTALDAMVKAMAGQAWLTIQSQTRHGHIAIFFHGQPDLGTSEYWDFHVWPDKDRIEFTKHRDVVQFFLGRAGTEVTYKGKAPLPQDIVDDYLRRRDHSIETAVKTWLNDPQTILVYEGKHLAERHLAEQVTLISPQNESITILMDVQTHLPLRRTFQWRDPVYKDKNTDAEEYDDYHVVDGLPTAFSITRFKNDEMVRQYYVDKVEYNQALPPDIWSIDAADHRIKK